MILVLTATAFVRYFQAHPQYLSELRHTEWPWLIGILIANFCGITALAALYQVLVQMTGKRLGTVENWLLTIYSSIANFFGPLQSGPGVRAAYLKTKHQVKLRAYFLATLLYYGIYAVFSAFFLLVGARPWWQTILACLVAAGISGLVIRWTAGRQRNHSSFHITAPLMTSLIGFTLLQIMFIGIRYYFALRAAGTEVSLGQLVSYTGAANFALFVSITPDGIGIREAFLLFAQGIHHVSTQAIVTASLIDRATYVVFLGLLFIIALGIHARDRFRLIGTKDSGQPAADDDATGHVDIHVK